MKFSCCIFRVLSNRKIIVGHSAMVAGASSGEVQNYLGP